MEKEKETITLRGKIIRFSKLPYGFYFKADGLKNNILIRCSKAKVRELSVRPRIREPLIFTIEKTNKGYILFCGEEPISKKPIQKTGRIVKLFNSPSLGGYLDVDKIGASERKVFYCDDKIIMDKLFNYYEKYKKKLLSFSGYEEDGFFYVNEVNEVELDDYDEDYDEDGGTEGNVSLISGIWDNEYVCEIGILSHCREVLSLFEAYQKQKALQLKENSEIIRNQVDKELADLYLILQKYFSFEDKKDFPVEGLVNFKKKE